MGFQDREAFSRLFSFAKEKLPNSTGVYFFKDPKGKILYIGKSIRIRERILQHIAAAKTDHREARLCYLTEKIDFELCGSELISLLYESQLIKKHLPLFNRAGRKTRGLWYWKLSTRRSGFLDILVERKVPQLSLLEESKGVREFLSFRSATEMREKFFKESALCLDPDLGRACFWSQIDICRGVCAGQESVEQYNERLKAALKLVLSSHLEDKIFFDKGRNSKEQSFVVIQDSKLKGWGYIPRSQAKNPQALERALVACPDYPDLQKILRAYFNENFKKALSQMLKGNGGIEKGTGGIEKGL